MAYDLAKISMNALMRPALNAGVALTRLDEWRGVLLQAQHLPAVLQAIIALDAWNELSVLQHALLVRTAVLRLGPAGSRDHNWRPSPRHQPRPQNQFR